MHAPERPEEGAQPSAGSFTAVAVDLPHAVAIVIACPLVLSVIDGRVRRLDPVVTPILVRIDDCAIGRYGFGKYALAGRLVAMADHPAALFATLTADDMNDRWP